MIKTNKGIQLRRDHINMAVLKRVEERNDVVLIESQNSCITTKIDKLFQNNNFCLCKQNFFI